MLCFAVYDVVVMFVAAPYTTMNNSSVITSNATTAKWLLFLRVFLLKTEDIVRKYALDCCYQEPYQELIFILYLVMYLF